MNELKEKIRQLSDEDVARLALWILDEERDEIEGLDDVSSEEIISAFNALLKGFDLEIPAERPADEKVVKIFRYLLSEYAAAKPEATEEVMKDLGMEAGGFELFEILQNIDVSDVFLIIALLSSLKSHFKVTHISKDKRTKIEFGLGSSESIIKELLKKLFPGSG